MKEILDKDRLVTHLKSRMIAVDHTTMPNDTFLYSIGYNNAITTLLIDIANGDFS